MVYCVVVSSTGNRASVPLCEGYFQSFQSNPQHTNELIARINHSSRLFPSFFCDCVISHRLDTDLKWGYFSFYPKPFQPASMVGKLKWKVSIQALLLPICENGGSVFCLNRMFKIIQNDGFTITFMF